MMEALEEAKMLLDDVLYIFKYTEFENMAIMNRIRQFFREQNETSNGTKSI